MQHLFIYRREAAERMRLDLWQHAITQRIHLDLAVHNLVNLGRRLQSDWNLASLTEWCAVEERQRRRGRQVTPKLPEMVITQPAELSPSSSRSLAPDCLKNKRMGFDSGDRLDLCAWARGHVGVFHACGLIRWRSRDGDIFYEEHSCRGAIVCAARWQAGNPGDGWRPADEKNK